mgnify:CR=1 FL=1
MIAFKVKEVIATSLRRNVEEVRNEVNVFSDLCDGVFERAFLLHDLETTFSCELIEDEVDRWETVGDIVDTMCLMPEVRNYCFANQ